MKSVSLCVKSHPGTKQDNRQWIAGIQCSSWRADDTTGKPASIIVTFALHCGHTANAVVLLARCSSPTPPTFSSWNRPTTSGSSWRSTSTCARGCWTFTAASSCTRPWTRKHGMEKRVEQPVKLIDAETQSRWWIFLLHFFVCLSGNKSFWFCWGWPSRWWRGLPPSCHRARRTTRCRVD